MILYLAGSIGPNTLERVADKAGANHFLFTFAHKDAQECARHFCVQPQRRILVDSGAFSAWSKGREIDLANYIAFCKEIQSIAKCPVTFAALDVIPGKRGDGLPTPAQIRRACDEGWANYQAMRQDGIPCLMTYHELEETKQLTRIVDNNDYFMISPRKADIADPNREIWLKEVFAYVGSSKKIHGLGVASVPWMKQFPFYSVDNTGWLGGGKWHGRRVFGTTRYKSRLEWEDLARRYGFPEEALKYVRHGLGYDLPGENADPNGHSGNYWLMELAMESEVYIEWQVTKHWQRRGVVWDDRRVPEKELEWRVERIRKVAEIKS